MGAPGLFLRSDEKKGSPEREEGENRKSLKSGGTLPFKQRTEKREPVDNSTEMSEEYHSIMELTGGKNVPERGWPAETEPS